MFASLQAGSQGHHAGYSLRCQPRIEESFAAGGQPFVGWL